MSEHPIIFSGPMVRAILDGRKTQTRRIIKPQPGVPSYFEWRCEAGWWRPYDDLGNHLPCYERFRCPYGVAGDTLWVRETHYRWGKWLRNGRTPSGRQAWTFKALDRRVRYALDEELPRPAARDVVGWWKRPSIFMPRWACRLLLTVESVRVERVQDISEDDAELEGIDCHDDFDLYGNVIQVYRCGDFSDSDPASTFRKLWDSINAKRGHPWSKNDWVWAVTFRKQKGAES